MKNHGGQQCTVCTHAQRKEIEQLLVKKTPLRLVAGQFRLSKTAVFRHSHHLSPVLVKAAGVARDAVREQLDDDLNALIVRTRKLLQAAQRGRDVGPQLRVIHQLQSLLELKAKVAGKIDDEKGVQVHFNISPEKALLVARTFVERHDGKLLSN